MSGTEHSELNAGSDLLARTRARTREPPRAVPTPLVGLIGMGPGRGGPLPAPTISSCAHARAREALPLRRDLTGQRRVVDPGVRRL